MKLLAWPKAAAFGRAIPKRKIYDHADAKTALKDLFVQDVDQITWAYKLAPETINIPATRSVSEIQVFQIKLKTSGLDDKVLQAIDKAIPFPLLFELSYRGQVRLAAAYKRPHETDGNRWVVGRYFESGWQPEDAQREPLPMALNLSVLYEQLLTPLVDASNSVQTVPPTLEGVQDAPANYDISGQRDIKPSPQYNNDRSAVSLEQRIALAEAIDAKQKEIDQIQSRLKREKQFNRRVAINSELREAKQQLARLQARQPAIVSH
ncbi:DUF4391 domain-containing protein [Marinobacterium rhizophilum]|uniref:DUF4391 domain-containing protein n=1 Tax=Marinobacterium rhizophilum TaxID=420402 RepID=UPI00035DF3EC|nr:DUF4391 domain-containing protein [Marinobacterium rhizophilum]